VAVIRCHGSGRQDNIHGKLAVKQHMHFSQGGVTIRLNIFETISQEKYSPLPTEMDLS
jgi:hypothetical protein